MAPNTRRGYNATPEDQREPLVALPASPPPRRRHPPNQSGGDGGDNGGASGSSLPLETAEELSMPVVPAIAAPPPNSSAAAKRARGNTPTHSSSSSPQSGGGSGSDSGAGGSGSGKSGRKALCRRLRKQLKELERERQELLTRLTAAQRNLCVIEGERQDTRRAVDTLAAVLHVRHADFVRERDERVRQEQRVDELRADVTQRELAIAQLNARLAEVQAKLDAVQARLDELQAQPTSTTPEFVRGAPPPSLPEMEQQLLCHLDAHGTVHHALDKVIAFYTRLRLGSGDQQ